MQQATAALREVRAGIKDLHGMLRGKIKDIKSAGGDLAKDDSGEDADEAGEDDAGESEETDAAEESDEKSDEADDDADEESDETDDDSEDSADDNSDDKSDDDATSTQHVSICHWTRAAPSSQENTSANVPRLAPW